MVREFSVDVIKHLIQEIGWVAALLDNETNLSFLERTWCVFELFCAAATKARLQCLVGSGWRWEAEEALKKHPVNCREATTLKAEDRKLILDFIEQLDGGADGLDEMLTKVILKSNNILGIKFDADGKWVRDEDGNEVNVRADDDGDEHWEEAAYVKLGHSDPVKWRRSKDGYSGIWDYTKSGSGEWGWVSSAATAEDDAHWDPVFEADGTTLVRNRWTRQRREWVHGE